MFLGCCWNAGGGDGGGGGSGLAAQEDLPIRFAASTPLPRPRRPPAGLSQGRLPPQVHAVKSIHRSNPAAQSTTRGLFSSSSDRPTRQPQSSTVPLVYTQRLPPYRHRHASPKSLQGCLLTHRHKQTQQALLSDGTGSRPPTHQLDHRHALSSACVGCVACAATRRAGHGAAPPCLLHRVQPVPR